MNRIITRTRERSCSNLAETSWRIHHPVRGERERERDSSRVLRFYSKRRMRFHGESGIQESPRFPPIQRVLLIVGAAVDKTRAEPTTTSVGKSRFAVRKSALLSFFLSLLNRRVDSSMKVGRLEESDRAGNGLVRQPCRFLIWDGKTGEKETGRKM